MSFGHSKRFVDPKDDIPPVGHYNPLIPGMVVGPATFGKSVSKETLPGSDAPAPGYYEVEPMSTTKQKRSASIGRKSVAKTGFQRHSSCSSLETVGSIPPQPQFLPAPLSKLPVLKRIASARALTSGNGSMVEPDVESLRKEISRLKGLVKQQQKTSETQVAEIQRLTAKLTAVEEHERIFRDQMQQHSQMVNVIQDQHVVYANMSWTDSQVLTEMRMKYSDEIISLKNEVETRREEIEHLRSDVKANSDRYMALVEETTRVYADYEQQIGSLSDQLRTAQEESAAFGKALEDHQKKCDNDTAQFVAQIDSLTKSNEEKTVSLSDVKNQFEDAVAQISAIRSAHEGEINQRDQRISSLVGELQTATDELNVRALKLQSADDKCGQLQVQLNTANSDVASLEAKLHSVNEECFGLRKDIVAEQENSRNSCDLLNKHIEELTEKLSSVEGQLLVAEKQKSKDDGEIDSLKEQLHIAQEQYEKGIHSVQEECGELREVLDDQTKKYRSHTTQFIAEIKSLRSSNEEKAGSLDDLHSQLTTANDQMSKMASTHEEETKKREECISGLSVKLQTAADESEAQVLKLQSVEDECSRLQIQLNTANSDVETLKERLRIVEEEICRQLKAIADQKEKFQADCDLLNDQITDLQKELSGVNVQLSTVQQQKENDEKELASLHEQFHTDQQEYEKRISSLQEECGQLRQDLNQRQQQYECSTAQLNAQKDSLQQNNDELQQKQSALESELTANRNKMAAERQEFESAQSKREKQHADDLQRRSAELDLVRSDNVQLQKKLSGVIKSLEQFQVHSSAELDALNKEIATLQQKSDTAEEMIGQLDKKVVDTESSNATLIIQLEMTQTEEQKLRGHLQVVQTDSDALANENSLLVEANSRLQAEVQRLNDRIGPLQDQLRAMRDGEAEVERLREELDQLRELIGPFQDQLRQYAAENADLAGRGEQSEQQLKRLFDSYSEVLGHHNEKQRIKHIAMLKDELLVLRKENPKLKEENSSLKRQLAMVRGDGKARLDALAKPRTSVLKENNSSRPI